MLTSHSPQLPQLHPSHAVFQKKCHFCAPPLPILAQGNSPPTSGGDLLPLCILQDFGAPQNLISSYSCLSSLLRVSCASVILGSTTEIQSHTNPFEPFPDPCIFLNPVDLIGWRSPQLEGDAPRKMGPRKQGMRGADPSKHRIPPAPELSRECAEQYPAGKCCGALQETPPFPCRASPLQEKKKQHSGHLSAPWFSFGCPVLSAQRRRGGKSLLVVQESNHSPSWP